MWLNKIQNKNKGYQKRMSDIVVLSNKGLLGYERECVGPSECCKYQWLPGGSGGTEFGQEGEGILLRK